MKKIYIFFLVGQLIIFSCIFSSSIYDIYGLSHIGDSELQRYMIQQPSPNILGKVYDELEKEKADVQIIKMPISNDDGLEVTIYQIYHSNIEKIKQFKSISKNHYEYYKITQEDFADGTGVFYTNLDKESLYYIAQRLGITILQDNNESYVSYKSFIKQNALDFIILLIVTQVVMFIYVISTGKQNAVKKLLGFSTVRILKDRVYELIKIEGMAIGLIALLHVCYYTIQGKISLFYVMFLVGFLCCIGIIDIALMLFTQSKVKRIDIVSAMKNQMFTPIINNIVQIVKVVLIYVITIAISISIQYYHELSQAKDRIENYKELNNFYSSYGYNSDEYKKICNDSNSFVEMGNRVKQMYQNNMDKAYLMDDTICRKLDEHYLRAFGKTVEQLMDSYKDNNITVNTNYLNEYMNIPECSNIDLGQLTILVPEKYKDIEGEVEKFYKQLLQERMYSEFYGETPVELDAIQIVYIEDNHQYKLLSSLQYEQNYDVRIRDSIIIVDNGEFSGTYYMQALSECQLAFKEYDKDEFNVMLSENKLNELLPAYTMLIPFMQEISNYEFLVGQSVIFIGLFFVTLLFIIYVSNYIEIQVYSKKYGVLYQMGHSLKDILSKNMFIIGIMGGASIALLFLNINIISYLIFVLFDFIVLLYLYNKIITRNLYKILNGGN